MEDPDRFEAAHVRHENIDDHEIERLAVERPQARLAAIGNRYLEIVPFEIDLDGHTDHRIIVHHENARHVVSPWLGVVLGMVGKAGILLHASLLRVQIGSSTCGALRRRSTNARTGTPYGVMTTSRRRVSPRWAHRRPFRPRISTCRPRLQPRRARPRGADADRPPRGIRR